MKLIKSTITALGLLFTVTACAGNKESKNQNMKGENMEIVHLTKAEFLKKVYNYEANPNDWKYEGDKPAIVENWPVHSAYEAYRLCYGFLRVENRL